MIRNSRFHRGRDAQTLVNPAEVVIRLPECHGDPVVLPLLTEAVGQSREATAPHADAEVAAFDDRGADPSGSGLLQSGTTSTNETSAWEYLRRLPARRLVRHPAGSSSATLGTMRRGVHIFITLVVILVLVRPFDCFAGSTSGKAADCCAKGKCLPTRYADDCCKASLPADTQVIAAKISHFTAVPSLEFSAIVLPMLIAPEAVQSFSSVERLSVKPPGSPPGSNRNLPLLV